MDAGQFESDETDQLKRSRHSIYETRESIIDDIYSPQVRSLLAGV